jgi:hypothetical protein
MHTSFTLDVMNLEVARLGYELRKFATVVCPRYDTRDLPKDIRARARATQRRKEQADATVRAAPAANAAASSARANGGAPPRKRQRLGADTDDARKKEFTLDTFKIHNLGHYSSKISRIGTTDNYNTALVS